MNLDELHLILMKLLVCLLDLYAFIGNFMIFYDLGLKINDLLYDLLYPTYDLFLITYDLLLITYNFLAIMDFFIIIHFDDILIFDF